MTIEQEYLKCTILVMRSTDKTSNVRVSEKTS